MMVSNICEPGYFSQEPEEREKTKLDDSGLIKFPRKPLETNTLRYLRFLSSSSSPVISWRMLFLQWNIIRRC